MTDPDGVVQCPKCGQWFDGPKAHHAHYNAIVKVKKGQTILDHFECGDPGPIVRAENGRRIHGERRSA